MSGNCCFWPAKVAPFLSRDRQIFENCLHAKTVAARWPEWPAGFSPGEPQREGKKATRAPAGAAEILLRVCTRGQEIWVRVRAHPDPRPKSWPHPSIFWRFGVAYLRKVPHAQARKKICA